jgi:hypothetical protein
MIRNIKLPRGPTYIILTLKLIEFETKLFIHNLSQGTSVKIPDSLS